MNNKDNRLKKVLILGASSFVGRHLFSRLGADNAIGTYCANSIEGGLHFDSTSMKLTEIIDDHSGISCAVVLMGDTNPETCAADKQRSRKLNVESIKSILKYLKQWRIKPIFTSSEFVFDGEKGNYQESDTPRPILTYGRQKLEIEEYLEDNFKDFAILRLSKVFGSDLGDRTIFSKWLDLIIKDSNVAIPCADDQVFSPIFVNDVVESIIRLIDRDSCGIFHLAGKMAFARIELLEMLLWQLNKYRRLKVKVIPRSIRDFNLLEKRPLDVSMRPEKLVKALGLRLSNTEDICQEIVKKHLKRQM